MKGKRHTAKRIIARLREAEADLNAGQSIGQQARRQASKGAVSPRTAPLRPTDAMTWAL
jgi:hypothetical protein